MDNARTDAETRFQSARSEITSITTLLTQGTASLTQQMEYHATVFEELCADDRLSAVAQIQAAVAQVLRDIGMYSVFFLSFPLRLNNAATVLVDSGHEIAAGVEAASKSEQESVTFRDNLINLQQNTEFALQAAVGYRDALAALAATNLSDDIHTASRNEEATLTPMIDDMERVKAFCNETIMLLNSRL